MKRNLIIICSLLIGSLIGSAAIAQQTVTLAPDQNPNYMVSVRKYSTIADTLNNLHSTTIQDTYKAYDWYEARQERRQQNRIRRRDVHLNSGYGNYPYSGSFYDGYSYPYNFGNYGYGNRFYGRGRWGFSLGL